MSTREDREYEALNGEYADDTEPIEDGEEDEYYEPESAFLGRLR